MIDIRRFDDKKGLTIYGQANIIKK